MGSRSREQTAHQPLLSSLVVRLTNNERTADFEPGEVTRDPTSTYSRSARFYQDAPPPSSPGGYRVLASSVSPVHRRDNDHHFNSTVDRLNESPLWGRGRGRDSGRYHQSPPRFSRGRGADRPLGRSSAGIRRPGPFRGETTGKSNPNVEPREGDWYCSDPACNNLNFARRDQCNNCHRPRRGTELSPRRGHPVPPQPLRRFNGVNLSPRRASNGYRSPPRVGRSYGVDLPDAKDRREDKFADRQFRRDHPGYLEDGFYQRNRFDRHEPPISYAPRVTVRDGLFHDRKGYERRMTSPPLPSIHPPPPPVEPGRWARDRSRSPILTRDELLLKDYRRGSYSEHERNERHEPLPLSALPRSPVAVSGRWARERSRSPLRNELPPLKDYHRGREPYMNRGRDDRHGLARGRDAY